MTLEELYSNYSRRDPLACDVLSQADWYSSVAVSDPRSAEALPQPLSAVLQKISSFSESVEKKDRLWRIVEHVRPSLEKLYRGLNESPRREHAVLPLRAVRELDTSSFMALSRRPGRNVREKLAGRPYLQAVRCFQSIDLPENRLLKAVSERLLELLEIRRKCFHPAAGDEATETDDPIEKQLDELQKKIQSWLMSEDADAIGRWENLPPNNTMLSHRHYRAVYDAWCWMRSLNENLEKDIETIGERREIIRRWTEYGEMYRRSEYLFAEMPVFFDYDKFIVKPWTDTLEFRKGKVLRLSDREKIHVPVCIDLTSVYPDYAYSPYDGSAGGHPVRTCFEKPFLWQNWPEIRQAAELEMDQSFPSVDIDLFHADAACLHEEVTTISLPDLFFSDDHTEEHEKCLERAARTFVTRLSNTFTSNTIFWLQPDSIKDFDLEIIRRNLNAAFPNAEPLLRSVAAVFDSDQIDYRRLKDKYSVVVLDTVGGIPCATKLEACFDKRLKEKMPETLGFCWERQSTVKLSHAGNQNGPESRQDKTFDFVTVDSNGQWHSPKKPQSKEIVDPESLCNDDRIGHFDQLIVLSKSPVQGGIRLYELQKKLMANLTEKELDEIRLWRYQIPELSMKGVVNGRYQRFGLVSRGTMICPVRGKAVPIPIHTHFDLPRNYKTLPLFMGKAGVDEEDTGFSAVLEQRAFPPDVEKLECRLNMTFTYGADDPYCLVFEPLDKSVLPIRVHWRRTEELSDARGPEFPKPLSWDELQRFLKPDNTGTTNLLTWVAKIKDQFESDLYLFPRRRATGVIIQPWKTDSSGLSYTYAQCDDSEKTTVFIHEKSLVNGYDTSMFKKGDRISFVLIRNEEAAERETGFIADDWKTDTKGNSYTCIRRKYQSNGIRVYPSAFLDWVDYLSYRKGDKVSFEMKEKEIRTNRETGVIISYWKQGSNGNLFTFIQQDSTGEHLYVNEFSLVDGLKHTDFQPNDRVSFEVTERNGKKQASKTAPLNYTFYSYGKIADAEYSEQYRVAAVASEDYQERKRIKTFDTEYRIRSLILRIHKAYFFPIIHIWRNGHSISEKDCPPWFKGVVEDYVNFLRIVLSEQELPEAIKDEIRSLLIMMHKDAPAECARWIKTVAKQGKIFRKLVVGFALGDVSQPWQKELFTILVNHPDNDAMRTLAYAIWREQHVVEHFSLFDCQNVLNRLSMMLDKIEPLDVWKEKYDSWNEKNNTGNEKKNNWKYSKKITRNWNRSITEPLELLLGMLRTRESSDESIRMLLQPSQKRTKEFARQIERIEGIVAESGGELFSRVQLNLPPKPEGDNTPDLLYALRLYLTGDDGANAIQITGVSDNEDEE